MVRVRSPKLWIALAFVLLAASPSLASELKSPPPTLLEFRIPACQVLNATAIPAPTPIATWTFLGCWKSRPWVTTCNDVFRDGDGVLYVCRACGTTGTPSKGKCRETTQAELDSGTWCGAVE